MVSAYGFSWRKRRFGGIFTEEYNLAKQRESFLRADWNEYQNFQLQKLLQHSFQNVPFYKNKYTEFGFNLNSLSAIDIQNLHILPVTSKEEVRRFGTTDLLALNKNKHGSFFSSSGSTGTPVQIYYSHNMHQRWFALYEARVRNWASVSKATPRGMIGGRRIVPDASNNPPFFRYNYFEKQVYFSAYHISPKNIADYAKAFEKYDIEYMTGYAMSNFFLARMFKENNIHVTPLKAVITSSEKLTDEMRKMFLDVYGCKTFDSWSGMEFCGLISECEHGSLHINPDAGIIEVLNDEMKPVGFNEAGNVYCTGLLNFDQPLIRYKIGDKIVLSEKQCGCGRQMPVVKEIVGRTEDIVYGKDGREMVRFHGVFVGLKSVKLSQLIQEDLDTIIIKIVPDGSLQADEKLLIEQRIKSQLGDIKIHIKEVKNIPLTANGKFKAVISKIKKPHSL